MRDCLGRCFSLVGVRCRAQRTGHGSPGRLSRVDVRWDGDGNLSAGGAPGAAADASVGWSDGRALRPALDGDHYRTIPAGCSMRRPAFRLDWGSRRAREGDDLEHSLLFAVHGVVLFRGPAVAAWRISIHRRVWNGWRMGPGSGAGHGSLA